MFVSAQYECFEDHQETMNPQQKYRPKETHCGILLNKLKDKHRGRDKKKQKLNKKPIKISKAINTKAIIKRKHNYYMSAYSICTKIVHFSTQYLENYKLVKGHGHFCPPVLGPVPIRRLGSRTRDFVEALN